MFYYGLAYTIFVSLEFALHDSLMEYFTAFTGDSSTSILKKVFMKKTEIEEIDDILDAKPTDKHSHYHHWHNELIGSFLAGSLAAFITNGLEMIAVNK